MSGEETAGTEQGSELQVGGTKRNGLVSRPFTVFFLSCLIQRQGFEGQGLWPWVEELSQAGGGVSDMRFTWRRQGAASR